MIIFFSIMNILLSRLALDLISLASLVLFVFPFLRNKLTDLMIHLLNSINTTITPSSTICIDIDIA